MSNCHEGSGRKRGALKAGEARTLLGMVVGVAPEPVECFLLISLLKCPDCGENHRLVLDKDVPCDVAIELLQDALGLMIMNQRYTEGFGAHDSIYGESDLWGL